MCELFHRKLIHQYWSYYLKPNTDLLVASSIDIYLPYDIASDHDETSAFKA